METQQDDIESAVVDSQSDGGVRRRRRDRQQSRERSRPAAGSPWLWRGVAVFIILVVMLLLTPKSQQSIQEVPESDKNLDGAGSGSPWWQYALGGIMCLLLVRTAASLGKSILHRASFAARTSVDPSLASWVSESRADGWSCLYGGQQTAAGTDWAPGNRFKMHPRVAHRLGVEHSLCYVEGMDQRQPELRRLACVSAVLDRDVCQQLVHESALIEWTVKR